MGLFSSTPKVSTDLKAIDELLSRAVASVIPRELGKEKLSSGARLRIYMGIDPTGAKLHLGHSVGLRKLRAFTDAGHHVIFLIGSFTAMIGDPTDREAMRPPLTKEEVEKNFKDYKRQAQKILDFSKVEIRYNDEWLAPLGFGDIVKLASNFTVQQMLQRDMFEKRMEENKPIALHEFLYPLMVGYDSVMLDVDCEMGGSDQEFNMLAGRQLQKAFGKREKFVLTTRLIEGADGRKMSKSYGNCVYLEDEPSEMFGKMMSIKDELMPMYFECTTGVPMDEVKKILEGHPKEAKMRLAKEITTLYHGKDAAQKAEENFTNTFSEGGVPTDIPEATIVRGEKYVDVLCQYLGESKSELRRLAEAGAITEVNGQTIRNILSPITHSRTLRIGKHRFLKITVK